MSTARAVAERFLDLLHSMRPVDAGDLITDSAVMITHLGITRGRDHCMNLLDDIRRYRNHAQSWEPLQQVSHNLEDVAAMDAAALGTTTITTTISSSSSRGDGGGRESGGSTAKANALFRSEAIRGGSGPLHDEEYFGDDDAAACETLSRAERAYFAGNLGYGPSGHAMFERRGRVRRGQLITHDPTMIAVRETVVVRAGRVCYYLWQRTLK